MDIETKLIRIDREQASHGSFIDPEYVMHIVFQGNFLFQNQQDAYSIESRDLILISPNKLHALHDVKEVDMMVIHFYDHTKVLEGLDLSHVISLDRQTFTPIETISTHLYNIWTSAKENTRFIIDGLVHTLVGYFIEYATHQNMKTKTHQQFFNWKSIQQAVSYIQENFTNSDISISEVSRHCQLSYNYFSFLFKQYTNESPHHYLTRVRLEYAKEQIFNGKYNISQAAQASGFCNLQYFSKVFKKHEGIPPREWLRKLSYS
jgi:AraC-like DNA-binding protein